MCAGTRTGECHAAQSRSGHPRAPRARAPAPARPAVHLCPPPCSRLIHAVQPRDRLQSLSVQLNPLMRYYVGKHLAVDNQNRIRNFILVGFENPKELSLFNLSCPHIHR